MLFLQIANFNPSIRFETVNQYVSLKFIYPHFPQNDTIASIHLHMSFSYILSSLYSKAFEMFQCDCTLLFSLCTIETFKDISRFPFLPSSNTFAFSSWSSFIPPQPNYIYATKPVLIFHSNLSCRKTVSSTFNRNERHSTGYE